MSSIVHKKRIMLNDGRRLIVKEAEESEANELIRFISIVAGEGNYLTFGPGEYKIRIIDEKKFIKSYRESENQAVLIGRVQNEIVGQLVFKSDILQKIRHIGEIAISVSKKNWGRGIGTSIMTVFLEWAEKSEKIRKIKLRVRSDNYRAIAMYKKLGFVEERSIAWGFFNNSVMGRKLK